MAIFIFLSFIFFRPYAFSGKIPAKDPVAESLFQIMEQVDKVHREAWWVLTNERYTPQRSPFGKVQRAVLSFQGKKLANKSLFKCDRYLIDRPTNHSSYPQSGEIFEKCNEKAPPRKIATFMMPKAHEVSLTFYPENLGEVLGVGPSVLNVKASCSIVADDLDKLQRFTCKNWTQDRTASQMIRLDTYEYRRGDKVLIKLSGKVFENLTDTRMIEVEVPSEGKIFVKETELYPPPDKIKNQKPKAPAPVLAIPPAATPDVESSLPVSAPVPAPAAAQAPVVDPNVQPDPGMDMQEEGGSNGR